MASNLIVIYVQSVTRFVWFLGCFCQANYRYILECDLESQKSLLGHYTSPINLSTVDSRQHCNSIIIFAVSNQRFSTKAALKFLVNSSKNEGLTSLWRGNSATLIRIVPYAAVQFTSHEQFKIMFSKDSSQQWVIIYWHKITLGLYYKNDNT